MQAEYRYSNFGHTTDSPFSNPNAIVQLPDGGFFAAQHHLRESQVQAGFNYRFDMMVPPLFHQGASSSTRTPSCSARTIGGSTGATGFRAIASQATHFLRSRNQDHVSQIPQTSLACAGAFAAAAILAGIGPASAHTVIGQQNFPATLTIYDPGTDDELTLPTFTWTNNADGSVSY